MRTTKEIMMAAFQSMGIADAFGYDFEFNDPTKHTVRAALKLDTPLGITDDTQMALFGLEGLAAAATHPPQPLDHLALRFILPEYLAWYETQTKVQERRFPTWLAGQPLMQASRAPGNTCMGSLRQAYRSNTMARYDNHSKGDGAVMRSLPFVFAPWILGITEKEATALAVMSGELTHGHEESDRAVRMFMFLAFEMLREGDISMRVLNALNKEFPQDTQHLLEYPTKVICDKENTFTAMPALRAAITAMGEGYFSAPEDGPEEGFNTMLVECCANRGDSDTIGAIAGALWGLLEQPPVQLLARLKERDIITEAVAKTPVGDSLVRNVFPSQKEIQPE
jgi:ADP-ribosylglycohydrolase